jgi:fructose-1,6-bisphosphatase
MTSFGDNHEVTIRWINDVCITEKIPIGQVKDITELQLFIEFLCIKHGFFYYDYKGNNLFNFCFQLSCNVTFNGEVLLENKLETCSLPLKKFGYKKPDNCTWDLPENDDDSFFPFIWFDDELMKILGFHDCDRDFYYDDDCNTGHRRDIKKRYVGYKKLSTCN